MSYDELKEEAQRLGLDFKGNIKKEELEELIRVAQEEEAIAAKNVAVEAAVAPIAVKANIGVKVAAPMTRNEAMQMIKVKVTPLDEALKGLPSDVYSVANKSIGAITQVVLFNKPTFVFKVIVEQLRATQMPIGTQTEKGTVEWSLVEAFSVTEIPLTEEELAALKAK